MNFILVTLPIRAVPTHFPPVGSTSLLDMLIKAGYNPKFYDIGALRPSFDEVVERFRKEKPDILGISAVVSTAYRYTKELTGAVKQVSPDTKIILGGCLAASAEILLRKCPIDVCVIGEGEKVLLNLVRYWEAFSDFDPSREEFRKIKGIAFLDSNNEFIFTGYEEQLPPEELPQPNYELLSRWSDIDRYIIDPKREFGHDSRFYQPHRRGRKYCFVMSGKGCVSRCTFCHRWVKGYRGYPIDNIIETIRGLRERYNVGFLSLGDESFGAIPSVMDEFIEKVGPLDILFRIGSMRISTVYRNPGIVRKLKEAGCVAMIFGMESGSDKILKVMEKGVTSIQNATVAKLLLKEKMYTVHQLVVGMPGENDGTTKETIGCIKAATEDADTMPIISTNYFQALPGTPGYEFMRSKGLIGNGLDDEEDYLLKISDVDAGSRAHYRNVTEEPLSKVFLWPHRIRVESTIHWYKRHGWRLSRAAKRRSIPDYFKTSRLYFRLVSLSGPLYWHTVLFVMRVRLYGLRKALMITLGLEREEDRSSFIIREPISLRKISVHEEPGRLSVSEANMLPLRMGR